MSVAHAEPFLEAVFVDPAYRSATFTRVVQGPAFLARATDPADPFLLIFWSIHARVVKEESIQGQSLIDGSGVSKAEHSKLFSTYALTL